MKLGADGMSSDDSATDDKYRSVYRVTIMAWRRHEITDYMELIDEERQNEDSGYSMQGAQPRPRVRSPLSKESSQGPIKRLPRNLYHDGWFEKNHRKLSLNISREQFQWLSVAAK